MVFSLQTFADSPRKPRVKMPKARGVYASEQTLELIKAAQAGSRDAADLLIENNTGLIMSVAKKYASKAAKAGLDFGDLLTEGQLGLWTAIEKYNENKGAKLSTYAQWWIRRFIIRAIHNAGRGPRLPVHLHSRIDRISRVTTLLTNKLGRKPEMAELAQETELTPQQITKAWDAARKTMSMQDVLATSDDGTVMELLDSIEHEPEGPTDLDERINDVQLYRHLEAALHEIPPNEAFVVQANFLEGLNLNQIAVALGIHLNEPPMSRERMRQLRENGLAKLQKRLRNL